MVISWQGFNYFKLQNGQHSLIFNPYSLDAKTKFSKAKANVVLFSDPAKVAKTKVNDEAMVIDSPGEYEISDIFVYGHKVKDKLIYSVIFEGITVAFLGEFGHGEMANGDLELIEGADILILPVGGGDLTNSKEAMKLISQIEPRLVIPSCHSSSSLSTFVKEFGVKPETVDKLRVKKKDLMTEDLRLVVLTK